MRDPTGQLTRAGSSGVSTAMVNSESILAVCPALSLHYTYSGTTTIPLHTTQTSTTYTQVRASVLAARTRAILILANDLIDRYFCSRLSGHHYFSIKWRLEAHMFDTAQTKSCHNDAALNNCNFCARDAAKSQIVVKIQFWADTIFLQSICQNCHIFAFS